MADLGSVLEDYDQAVYYSPGFNHAFGKTGGFPDGL